MNLKKIGSTTLALIMLSGALVNSASALEPSLNNNETLNTTTILEENQDIESDTSDTDKYSLIYKINNTTESEIENAKLKSSTFNDETPAIELYSEDQFKLLKFEFQKVHGIEDKLIEIQSGVEGIRVFVNGYKGIIKTIDQNGKEIVLNLFESFESLQQDALKEVKAPARPSSWKTQGPDKANISVVLGSSRDDITVSHPVSGAKKSYTKPTTGDNWYSGNTQKYYDGVKSGRTHYSSTKNAVKSGSLAALSSFIGSYISTGQLVVSTEALKAAGLAALGAAIIDLVVFSANGSFYLGNLNTVRTAYNGI